MDTGSVFSRELVTALNAIETSPWNAYKEGKPLTVNRLAAILKPYGVTPSTIRVGDVTAKGYTREDFKDPFDRYTSQDGPQPSHRRMIRRAGS